MKLNNIIKEYFSELRRGSRFSVRDKIKYFSKSIDEYKNIIKLI